MKPRKKHKVEEKKCWPKLFLRDLLMVIYSHEAPVNSTCMFNNTFLRSNECRFLLDPYVGISISNERKTCGTKNNKHMTQYLLNDSIKYSFGRVGQSAQPAAAAAPEITIRNGNVGTVVPAALHCMHIRSEHILILIRFRLFCLIKNDNLSKRMLRIVWVNQRREPRFSSRNSRANRFAMET